MFIRNRKTVRGGACLIVPVAVALVAGCSSSGGSGGASTTAAAGGGSTSASAGGDACVTTANTFMNDWSTLPTTLPSQYTPLSKKPAAGGLVIKIAKGSVPSDVSSAKVQATAAKAIGWTAKLLSFDGSVQDFNAKFDQAVAQHQTMITSSAGVTDPAVISGLAAAKAAGIVVSLSGMSQAPTGYPGYSASSLGPETYVTEAKIMSNWALKDSGCNVKGLVVSLSGIVGLENEATYTKKNLESACPKCSAKIVPVSPADLGSPAVTTAITSALQADPSIKYLFLTLGNIGDGLDVALKQAGISGVKILGTVPDEASFKALQDKTNSMWVDLSSDMNGYTELDAGLRAIDTGKPVVGLPFPLAVVTQDNVPATTPGVIPTLPASYQADFAKLWLAG